MSDHQQAPGWWQAADGKWYPPNDAIPQPGASGGTSNAALDEAKGFLKSLFDFRLQSFVTPSVLRFLYLVSVVLIGLGALLTLITALASKSPIVILGSLVFVPVLTLLYVVFARMYFELIAAFFNMAEDLRVVRRRAER